ncbi:hypothetical protein IAI10_05965 [Clostridium sp. 19966]|uniref:hypothetical protein n=1 Tax=Clostridium sp. 19966 TaxID=2768166 RepID=UPI0028E05BF1|nr:hypothetical protein [Clostridium sp. 19966]MDT8716195.1 hypothetical protein [Clostridium sp. 19966]
MESKNNLYNRKAPFLLFFILLSVPWVIQIKGLILSGKLKSAVELSIFTIVFLTALFFLQRWFKSMLIQYQYNLNLSVRKMKNKKMRRDSK